VIYSTSMGPDRDSDPLVSRRGDEPEDDRDADGHELFDQELEAPAADDDPPVREREPETSPTREPDPAPDRDPEPARERATEPRGSRREPAFEAEPARAEIPLTDRQGRPRSANMLPARHQRGIFERTFVRLIATGGIVGIGVAIAAIMSSSNSQGWLIGVVVSAVSVVLAAVLWSSRVL
jgi:hypothetical protein